MPPAYGNIKTLHAGKHEKGINLRFVRKYEVPVFYGGNKPLSLECIFHDDEVKNENFFIDTVKLANKCRRNIILKTQVCIRKGVEQLVRDVKDTLATEVTGKLAALKGLDGRLKDIRSYLDLVIEGKLPLNHEFVYQLQRRCYGSVILSSNCTAPSLFYYSSAFCLPDQAYPTWLATNHAKIVSSMRVTPIVRMNATAASPCHD